MTRKTEICVYVRSGTVEFCLTCRRRQTEFEIKLQGDFSVRNCTESWRGLFLDSEAPLIVSVIRGLQLRDGCRTSQSLNRFRFNPATSSC